MQPIEIEEKNNLPKKSRRSFLNRIWVLLGGLACLEFGWMGISTFSSHQKRQLKQDQETIIVAGEMEKFQPNTVTAISQGQFYLACLDDGSFLAISRACTHLGCSVPWDEEQHKFICPCHGSTFNLRGEVLSAPAPRPLDIFPVRIENRIVKVNISRPERREHFAQSQTTGLS
jgi:cytochrome b6-f complex iron-sulfur subunit